MIHVPTIQMPTIQMPTSLRRSASALLGAAALCLAALSLPGGAAMAQSFAPVLMVNDSGITGFELEQRTRFLDVLGAPGDTRAAAERALIEDRIRVAAAAREGIRPTPEAIEAGLAEFAGRAGLDTATFISMLAEEGIAPETFRDFVTAGLAWRDLAAGLFGARVRVTETDIDRALSTTAIRGRGVRLLLSEIIVAPAPNFMAEGERVAREISELRGETAFAEAARQYSAVPTREAGGRLPWTPLENLPPALRPTLLALQPGEATAPIPLEGAFAIFMLRAIDDSGSAAEVPQQLDYAELLLPGGRSEPTLAEAARLRAATDSCNDLYATSRSTQGTLTRQTSPLTAIPTDIAMELARLDPGEISTALVRGDAMVLLMLCDRQPLRSADAPAPNRDAVRNQITNERISALADAHLADLVANAIIRRP